MVIPAQTQHIEFQRTCAPPGLKGGSRRHGRTRVTTHRLDGRRRCRFPGVAGRLGAVAHLPSMSKSDPHETAAFGLEPMLTVRELSALLGVPVSTIYDWRIHGKGPVAHRLGKRLKYTVADVRTWVDAQRETAQGTGMRNPQPRHAGTARPPATVVVNHHHRDDTGTATPGRPCRRDDARSHDGGVR